LIEAGSLSDLIQTDMMSMAFINADLEITSRVSLEPIRDAFALHGNRFFELHCGEKEPGCFLASFEIHPESESSEETEVYRSLSAEEKIAAFCDSISELEGIARELWEGSSRRVIDLGYATDDHCRAFHDGLSVAVLQRMAELKIELAMTIYPKTLRWEEDA
jgi:hypothetical protein